MSDRRAENRVEPDAEFADRLERVLVDRLTAPVASRWHTSPDVAASETPSSNGEMSLTDLEVVPMDARPNSPGAGPRWLLVAASVAVLVAGVLVVTAIRDDSPAPAAPPETPAPTTTVAPMAIVFGEAPDDLEPGRYIIDPDGDPSTPLAVTYEVPEGWSSWIGAAKLKGRTHTLLTITTVDNVVRDGCLDHTELTPAVGETVDDLVTALTELAPFEVTAPPRDVTVFGHDGKYIRLTVPEMSVAGDAFLDCVGGELHSWASPALGGPFHGYDGDPGRNEEFWILDVAGTRLVVVANWSPDLSAAEVAELSAIFDSIRIQP